VVDKVKADMKALRPRQCDESWWKHDFGYSLDRRFFDKLNAF
jgi:hypothetical protein